MAAASIRGRILGAFGLSVATSGGALLYSLVQLRGIGQGLAVLDDGYLPIARVSAELGALARQMDQDHERIAREEGQPSPGQRVNAAFYSASLAEALRVGRARVEAAQSAVQDENELAAFALIIGLLERIDRHRESYDEAFLGWQTVAADPEQAPLALAALEARRTALLLDVGRLSDLVEARMQRVSARTSRAQVRAFTVSGALALLATLLSGGLAAVALFTLRPIGRLTEEAQRLGKGDYTGRVEVRTDDEVGLLAREFNAMAAAVSERDRRLQERARALDALTLQLRRVVDSIHAGLILTEGGAPVMVNPAAIALWGAEVEGRVPRALAALGPGRTEALTMAGRLFDVDVVPLGAEGSLIVGEDVTARNRDQERLARSERLAMVGQMLAQITHEVRNPLNAMSLHAELLAEDIEDPEHRAILATITAQIRRLEGLTARYLELSRGRRPELSPANPAELAREIVRLEEEALRRAGVRVELSGEVGLVELDAEALRRTLHNLLRNAVEAGAHLVRVRIGEEGGQLRVEMEDDGPGMAPEEAARAFEPFFTTKARGTGLGLAISRQEVEDVGGSLRCESRPGKGSIFSVRLPMQAC